MGASSVQIEHMNRQLSILQAITQAFVHRVGREQLIRDLPKKHEHVVLLRLSRAQETMYSAYLEVHAGHLTYTTFSVDLNASVASVQRV